MMCRGFAVSNAPRLPRKRVGVVSPPTRKPSQAPQSGPSLKRSSTPSTPVTASVRAFRVAARCHFVRVDFSFDSLFAFPHRCSPEGVENGKGAHALGLRQRRRTRAGPPPCQHPYRHRPTHTRTHACTPARTVATPKRPGGGKHSDVLRKDTDTSSEGRDQTRREKEKTVPPFLWLWWWWCRPVHRNANARGGGGEGGQMSRYMTHRHASALVGFPSFLFLKAETTEEGKRGI